MLKTSAHEIDMVIINFNYQILQDKSPFMNLNLLNKSTTYHNLQDKSPRYDSNLALYIYNVPIEPKEIREICEELSVELKNQNGVEIHVF